MNDTRKKLIDLITTQDLHVDTVGTLIDSENVDKMIKEAENYRLQLCDEYEVLTTPQVKEILLDHYNRLNANIRTLRFIRNHHSDVIPVLERCGN